MRCPDCNKFVAYADDDQPEVESLEIDEDGDVTGSVRVVLTCGECGTELKESTLDVNENIDEVGEDHKGDDHHLEIENDIESDGKSEGVGRYRRTYYGYAIHYTVKCACGFECNGTFTDHVQASAMEELT